VGNTRYEMGSKRREVTYRQVGKWEVGKLEIFFLKINNK
jgi:hypothetical protein